MLQIRFLKCHVNLHGCCFGNVAITVEPPVSGYPCDQKKRPLKRGVRLWEVKNVVFEDFQSLRHMHNQDKKSSPFTKL